MFAAAPLSTIYAVLFSISIVVTYITVRLAWLRLPTASVAGVIYTSVSFFLFALERGNTYPQAVIVGIFLGTTFTLVSVIIAGNFRALAAESEVNTKRKAPVALPLPDVGTILEA